MAHVVSALPALRKKFPKAFKGLCSPLSQKKFASSVISSPFYDLDAPHPLEGLVDAEERDRGHMLFFDILTDEGTEVISGSAWILCPKSFFSQF